MRKLRYITSIVSIVILSLFSFTTRGQDESWPDKVSADSIHNRIREAYAQQMSESASSKGLKAVIPSSPTKSPVKEIPCVEGVSATGARTYSIPIATASDVNLSPSIAISYNSQHLNGVAGWGWEISGISAISKTNDVPYFNDTTIAARLVNNKSWSLDGQMLVAHDDESFSDYQYKTARGQIYVKRLGASSTAPTGFEAVFPDGSFTYDALNRLASVRQGPLTGAISYDFHANATKIEYAVEMSYSDLSHPYTLTDWVPSDEGFLRDGTLQVSYASNGKPSRITESGVSADITYDGNDERAVMVVKSGNSTILTKSYMGGCFEMETDAAGTRTLRLYLDGGYYDAPAALVKTGDGDWTFYNIGRDYLGSIRYIADKSGNIIHEYSYDAWGRSRDPEDMEPLTRAQTPSFLLGRGYTGHEYLPWFALYNANARIYDPLLGRFLSPDPYVQAPDFTQSFNRYIYCLNNPLKYTDESGEIVWFVPIIVGALVGGTLNLIKDSPNIDGFWEGALSFVTGAALGALAVSAPQLLGVSSALGSAALSGAVGTVSDMISNGVSNIVKQSEGNLFKSKINWEEVLNEGKKDFLVNFAENFTTAYLFKKNPFWKFMRESGLSAKEAFVTNSALYSMIGATAGGLFDYDKDDYFNKLASRAMFGFFSGGLSSKLYLDISCLFGSNNSSILMTNFGSFSFDYLMKNGDMSNTSVKFDSTYEIKSYSPVINNDNPFNFYKYDKR